MSPLLKRASNRDRSDGAKGACFIILSTLSILLPGRAAYHAIEFCYMKTG